MNKPSYPTEATVRMALQAIQNPQADVDGRAQMGSRAFLAHCRRIDQIEAVLRTVTGRERAR